jgi:hypothetical protein
MPSCRSAQLVKHRDSFTFSSTHLLYTLADESKWGESEAKGGPERKRIRTQINGKFNDINSADENIAFM